MMAQQTSESINMVLSYLITYGKEVKPARWQATDLNGNTMVEIKDVFLKMVMEDSISAIFGETKANLPWSEDHFQERIGGVATNPGEQWKNWPYYKHGQDDERFRSTGKFSHTYQERFWPTKKQGIRFDMGNYDDIVERLKNDPTTRQAFLAIWHPEDQSNHGGRLPCTIGYWFNVEGNKLNITYLIRSCDAIRHFRNDVYMTQRLAGHTAAQLGLEVGIMTMWIGSFHCFSSDLYTLKKQLKN